LSVVGCRLMVRKVPRLRSGGQFGLRFHLKNLIAVGHLRVA